MRRIVIILLLIVAGLVLFLIPRERGINRTIVAVGLKVPEFELPEIGTDGKNPLKVWRSSELRGKVIFINFWASWCEECKKEKPSMQRLYEMMQGRQFQMLTILYRDDPEKAMGYMKENGFTIPVLFDTDDKLSYAFGVTGVPETYIIDKEGILRERIIGRVMWDDPEALGFIEDLLR